MLKKKIEFKKENISLIVLVSMLIILMLFIYLPKRRTVFRLESRWIKQHKSVESIQDILEEEDPRKIFELRKEYEETKTFFPENYEEVLKYISDSAYSSELNIVSILPGEVVPVLRNSKMIDLEDKNLFSMPVKIRVKSNYINLTSYLKTLELTSPHLIRVDKVKINKSTNSVDNLNVVLDLKFYFLTK